MDNYHKLHINLHIAVPKSLIAAIDKKAKSEFRSRNNWILKQIKENL